MKFVWICQGAFVLLWLLERRINYRRKDRRFQYFVGYFAALLSLAGVFFLQKLTTLGNQMLSQALNVLGVFTSAQWGVDLSQLLNLFPAVNGLSYTLALPYALNVMLLFVYLVLKPFLLWVSKRLCLLLRLYEPDSTERSYQYEREFDTWILKDNYIQLRRLFSALHIVTFMVTVAISVIITWLYGQSGSFIPPYPVFAVLTLNAVFDYLNGFSRHEYLFFIGADNEGSVTNRNYDLLRPILHRLFGDRLLQEGVKEAHSFGPLETNDEVINALITSEDDVERVYGYYLEKRVMEHHPIESSYVRSTIRILQGQSVLFATPFYRDLSDYLFYPMFKALLHHQRCMVVIGRDGMDDEICTWIEEGLSQVANTPSLWRIRFLQDYRYQPDVVIVPLKEIHNISLFEEARDCLRDVTFTILLEPSRIIARGQIGLSLLTSYCSQTHPAVFCSADVNHDGLVDTLSHLLKTNILNVSATHIKPSTCSEMLWDADGPYLHHRILSGISHYLGVGTEIGLVALKNQIPSVEWKSAAAFPVLDMRWIMQQYYDSICDYLNYPRNQHALDIAFRFSGSLWDLDAENNGFYIIEDELANPFECLRQYTSHISEHGFINVLSPNYLLRDYMQYNAAMFLCDPKAIPSFVPEHINTRRNCFLSLVMRMINGSIREEEVQYQLRLIGIETSDVIGTLNGMVSDYFGISPDASPLVSNARDVISEDKLSMESHIFYSMQDDSLSQYFLRMLRSAYYIAEDGQGERYFLASRLWGHVYQRYLPGQFCTFSGKYYQVSSISPEHGVMVRRAADHLTRRLYYRQVREYTIKNVVEMNEVAAQYTMQDIRVINMHGDLCVHTVGYYEMERFNDMATARRIEINNLPDRRYMHRHFIRIEFPDASPAVCQTLSMLINEIFVTIFPQSFEYITAIYSGAPDEQPEITTYTLTGETDGNCINIIEDSPIDLGLLTSVERNLSRLLEIVADYLSWHFEMINPAIEPSEPKTSPAFESEAGSAVSSQTVSNTKNKTGFFKQWAHRICRWWRKIRRQKNGESDIPASETKPLPEPKESEQKQADEPNVDSTCVSSDAEPDDNSDSYKDSSSPSDDSEVDSADDASEQMESSSHPGEQTSIDEVRIDPGVETSKQETMQNDVKSQEESGTLMPKDLDSAAPLTTDTPADLKAPANSKANTTKNKPSKTKRQRTQRNKTSHAGYNQTTLMDLARGNSDEADTEETLGPLARLSNSVRTLMERITQLKSDGDGMANLFCSPDYPECAFLNFGGAVVSDRLALSETLEYLHHYRFTTSSLSQARAQQYIAKVLEEAYDPRRKDISFCDFCGCELTAIEYDILPDGRKRCMNCSKTAIRTSDEFKDLFLHVRERMEALFGIYIQIPIVVKMISAAEMLRRSNKTPTPSSGFDERVIGVAIRKGKRHTLYIENGAPRMSAVSTIAHELTHIWQYQNWDVRQIKRNYKPCDPQVIYEGMAMWAEIQYLILINEPTYAKREEIHTRFRDDIYGAGFKMFLERYPLTSGAYITGASPFHTEKNKPI